MQVGFARRRGLPGVPPSSATSRLRYRSGTTNHVAELCSNGAVAKTRQHRLMQVSLNHNPTLRATQPQPMHLLSIRDQRGVTVQATAASTSLPGTPGSELQSATLPRRRQSVWTPLGPGCVEVSTQPAPALLVASNPLQFQVRPLPPGPHGRLRYGTAGTTGAVVAPTSTVPRARCTRRCIHDVSSGVRIAVTITDAAICTVASGAIAA